MASRVGQDGPLLPYRRLGRDVLSGDNFLRLIGGAKREVILVAPYIKAGALRRVINLLSAPGHSGDVCDTMAA